MKIAFFPTALVSIAASVGILLQTVPNQDSVDLLLRVVTELPIIVIFTWLILKLDDRRRTSNENLISGFRDLMEKDREWHKEIVKELLERKTS